MGGSSGGSCGPDGRNAAACGDFTADSKDSSRRSTVDKTVSSRAVHFARRDSPLASSA